ncbi:MAG: polysaccharide deacetylase family protein [Candidatus Hatepunaea meridiana]|nr:polysaccharide deacetylase family protein [Candidatus Hatepunaea meridiana]
MITDIFPRNASRFSKYVISHGDPDGVYLTFDDGPDPEYTPRLLDILDQYDCKATFFVTGMQAEKHKEILRRISKARHTICNHFYSHRSLWFANRITVVSEFFQAMAVLYDFKTFNAYLIRPPFGKFGLQLLKIVQELDLKIVLWSLSPGDYKPVEPSQLVKRIVNRVKPGDIVLLHDKGNYAKRTIEAMPDILESIKDKGLIAKSLQ